MSETPDSVLEHSPNYCTCCGEDLSGYQHRFIGRRQVIDIPPIQPIVTEHHLFEVHCKCGHCNKAPYPEGIIAPVSYGININGKNHWGWTFQNPWATCIAIHKSRGSKAISEIMPEGFDNKTLVTDCWAAYFKESKTSHQLCTAHLLRELKFFTQKYPENNWPPVYRN